MYLYSEFAFRAHFQSVERRYDLNRIENANQLLSTQDTIHEYSNEMGSVSALTNQIANLEKSILKYVTLL